jgi:hypothetical protein
LNRLYFKRRGNRQLQCYGVRLSSYLKAFGRGLTHHAAGVNVEACAQMRVFERIHALVRQCKLERKCEA